MEAILLAPRNMIFVSHAYPEDNLFTQWLALRLAGDGYPVWCDLTKLLGGEDFWRDIEAAIRERTVKFLYVLSKTSNEKAGTLMELAVAPRVGTAFNDFIIPLRIDDLPLDTINIELQRLISINFSSGWADGHRKLLKKFEDEKVERDARFTPDAVTQWWHKHYPAEEGVSSTPERCLSNWFEFTAFPKTLWLHSIQQHRAFEKLVEEGGIEFVLPARTHGRCVITFAGAEEIAEDLVKHGLEVDNSVRLKTDKFREHGLQRPTIEARTARNILSALFRDAFERFASSKGLLPYGLTGGSKYHWFKQDLIKDDKVFFKNASGEKTWRQMVGFKSLMAKEGECRLRNWHFGIQAKPRFWPIAGLAIRLHVAFTENGVLYDSKARQHSARRNQCRSWYNDDWVDRLLGAMSYLAGEGNNNLVIPLSADENVTVNRFPMIFESPVSFEVVDEQSEMEDEHDEEAHNEDSDDDEEEEGG
jgi:hypothetical protein